MKHRSRSRSNRTPLMLACAACALSAGSGWAIARDGQIGAAGHDERGFFIKSGDASMRFIGNVQFRYMVNHRDEPTDARDDTAAGFSNRRMRIGTSGSLTKELGYVVQADFLRGDQPRMLDIYASWKANDQWTIWAGQLKPAFLREEQVGHTRQLAVERSVMNSVFTLDYSQGVQATYTSGDIRVTSTFSDGARTLNAEFGVPAQADYALTARVDWKWAGEFRRFDQFTSWRGSDYAGMLGGALHWQDGGSTGNTNDQSLLGATVDAMAQGDGWNSFAAFTWRQTDAAGAQTFDDFALLAQGGVFLTAQLEGFARYVLILPDDDRATNEDFNEFGAGVNYYILPDSHAAKVTADVLYWPDAQARSIVPVSTANGLLSDSQGDQLALRLQFQVVF